MDINQIKIKNGVVLNLLDSPLEVTYLKTKNGFSFVLIRNGRLEIYRNEDGKNHAEILEDWLKKIAKEYIVQRTGELANQLGFKFNKIRIKGQKTRWGSCSSKKNLNFNWKLILTSKVCVDYVIIHELAHTKEMNHSKNFWDLVEQCMSDYKVHRKTLKKLHISF